MEEKFQYRLSKDEKNEIAQNLINILQNDADIAEQTKTFIYNWVLTVAREKRKAFFDVWEIVLGNYLPPKKERPVLFRACGRIGKKNKIASFTGRIESARRFSKGKGVLLICDTKERLEFQERFSRPGRYKNTFYPLVTVLKKAQKDGWPGFNKDFLNKYIGEDEYIMRVNWEGMHCFRWR